MSSDEIDKEGVIFLDFNDKLPSELLQNKVFFRLSNLEDKHPLVQVNDLIFKGTYDYSTGTNLFFKTNPNEDPIQFPFKEPTSIKLEFIHSQTKMLNCKQMKVPSTTAQLPANLENIKFDFQWDYKELLKKFENGTLDLQDMVAKKRTDEPVDESQDNYMDMESNEDALKTPVDIEVPDNDMDISEIRRVEDPLGEPRDELKVAYENLHILARTPARREITHEDCACDPLFKNDYDYRSIECKILEPPLFSYITNRTKTSSYENCCNLEGCVTMGLLSPSHVYPRILSNQEKNQIMKVENFKNLDLRARYSVLLSHMEDLETQIDCNTSEQNCLKDEFDRTPVETLQIMKRLVLSLKRRIAEFYI